MEKGGCAVDTGANIDKDEGREDSERVRSVLLFCGRFANSE